MKNYTITVNGQTYAVQVEEGITAAAQSAPVVTIPAAPVYTAPVAAPAPVAAAPAPAAGAMHRLITKSAPGPCSCTCGRSGPCTGSSSSLRQCGKHHGGISDARKDPEH